MWFQQAAPWIFFGSAGIVIYAYAGYWLLLRIASRRRPVSTAQATPTISILMAARSESASLLTKLRQLQDLSYPPHLIETIVVSDGSTDDTAAVLAQFPHVKAILLPVSGGKAAALNEGVRHATGELLFMMDARQRIDPDALEKLVPPFADPSVGAVSGELLLENVDGTPSGEALGIYWKIEKAIRRLESDSGSVVGVTGAIYLMRRELFIPMPPGLILDDVFLPMHAVRQGKRVLFQPAAIARDRIFNEKGKEFRRKVRTLTGNLQLIQAAPWLLSPGNPILFRFISHKMLRLLVPFLLLLMLVTSGVSPHPFMHFLFAAQLIFFALALMGMLLPGCRHSRLFTLPATFTMLNAAAALAFYKFLARKSVWQ